MLFYRQLLSEGHHPYNRPLTSMNMLYNAPVFSIIDALRVYCTPGGNPLQQKSKSHPLTLLCNFVDGWKDVKATAGWATYPYTQQSYIDVIAMMNQQSQKKMSHRRDVNGVGVEAFHNERPGHQGLAKGITC